MGVAGEEEEMGGDFALFPENTYKMNANNLTRQSNTHRCRVAQIVLSLRGADSEHIMQTEALCVCVRARVCVCVMPNVSACWREKLE